MTYKDTRFEIGQTVFYTKWDSIRKQAGVVTEIHDNGTTYDVELLEGLDTDVIVASDFELSLGYPKDFALDE